MGYMGEDEVNSEMEFRLAVMQDLPQIKAVYRQIVNNMNDQGIQIWDDIYPSEFFAEDIEKQRLYVLMDSEKIVSAFALCSTNEGAKAVRWKQNSAKALYIDRLGVDVPYAKRGIGSFMLAKAKETARVLGAEYLRLFVVDVNEPAIKLYIKNGFVKADGVFNEVFDDGFTLQEYGYETEVSFE